MIFNRTALTIIFLSVFCANCKPFKNSIDDSPLLLVLDENDLLKTDSDYSKPEIFLDDSYESKKDRFVPIDESSDEFTNSLNYKQLSDQYDSDSNQDYLPVKRDTFEQSTINSMRHQRQKKEKKLNR
jgi:hypothetical protein